jgi:hypothetical protein
VILKNNETGMRREPLLSDFPGSEKYDMLILGWVQYWNDIFKPEKPLDPKLIKALMASESSFRQDPPPGHIRKKDVKKLKNQLSPVTGINKASIQDAIETIKKIQSHHTLGMDWKALKDEGHK